MKRVIFVLGIGIGFVAGARAGRERYEQIKSTTARVATSEPVRQGVASAQELLDAATPLVVDRTRHYAGQAGEVSRRAAQRLGEGARDVTESAAESATDLYARLTTSADDLSARVTHTADELRARSEELRRLGEERFDEFGRRIEEQVERGRDSQAGGFVRAGDLRDQALAEIVSDEDDMLEPSPDASGVDDETDETRG